MHTIEFARERVGAAAAAVGLADVLVCVWGADTANGIFLRPNAVPAAAGRASFRLLVFFRGVALSGAAVRRSARGDAPFPRRRRAAAYLLTLVGVLTRPAGDCFAAQVLLALCPYVPDSFWCARRPPSLAALARAGPTPPRPAEERSAAAAVRPLGGCVCFGRGCVGRPALEESMRSAPAEQRAYAPN